MICSKVYVCKISEKFPPEISTILNISHLNIRIQTSHLLVEDDDFCKRKTKSLM